MKSVPTFIISKRKQSESKLCLKIEDFKLKALKISQSNSIIYLAIHKKTGLLFCLKSINKDKLALVKNEFINEIKMMMKSDDSRLAKLYGIFDDKQNIYLLS